ncbi:unnamed protein product [Bathycoccus prasinos]
MGARRRKLNRELLGIDRADERDDEESFLGSQDDHKRRKRQREKYIETRKATSEAFVAICAVAAVIFGLVLWAHTHHL